MVAKFGKYKKKCPLCDKRHVILLRPNLIRTNLDPKIPPAITNQPRKCVGQCDIWQCAPTNNHGENMRGRIAKGGQSNC